jgi:sugar lactone lactonase YvrE
MAPPVKLATGLGGAIGSDYVQSRNQVYFVEFNGKVSVLDLVRPLVGVVSQGTIVIKGTWIFDCETGTLGGLGTTGDIWWEQIDTVKRQMVPQNGAKIVNLGPVDFNSLTHVELQNLPYGTTPIPGNNDASNKLVNGDVFAVLTNAGNFTKIKVLNYGYDMKVQWVTYQLGQRYRVLGTGYNQPEDIKVTSGGRYAYVTERAGNLLRVDLTNADRAAAQVVASGLTAPHQIALDEAHGQAYVPEFTGGATGNIWRIDLSGGTKTAVYTGLQGCTGLLMSGDLRYAYVAEQVSGANRVARINLATAQRDVLASGLTAPFFMEWADGGESRVVLPQRDPANSVIMLDLTATPVKVATLASGVASRPSSLVLTAPGTMIVCSDSEIDQYDLASPLFSLAGPLFMGIGLVPVDHIINTGDNNADGYADTTDNPGYLLQVKDAPFGGALAIMVNHNAALLAGATYYKLFVSQVTPSATPPTEPRQAFSDYLWNAATSSFVPRPTGPDVDGFYPVRLPTQIWYNPLLGYVLDTSVLANGLCVIDIKLYDAAKAEIPVGSIHSRRVKIDNQWPVANIEKIFHDGSEVGVCAIVNSGSDQFTFRITASDPQGHMLSWGLSALWGDNRSTTVGGDDYSHHVSTTRQWAGVVSGDVPMPAWHATVAGDSSSTHCAHTFYLDVWDRTINGYGYLHHQTYHKSITIWL